MDKIMSARVDESVTFLLDRLAKKLQTSKKNVIETAFLKKHVEHGNVMNLQQQRLKNRGQLLINLLHVIIYESLHRF